MSDFGVYYITTMVALVVVYLSERYRSFRIKQSLVVPETGDLSALHTQVEELKNKVSQLALAAGLKKRD